LSDISAASFPSLLSAAAALQLAGGKTKKVFSPHVFAQHE